MQTEAQGIPIGLVLDGASRHDMKLVESTLQSQPPAVEQARAAWAAAGTEQQLCLDAGYDYRQVSDIVAAHGYTAHIRGQGEEKKGESSGPTDPPLGRGTDSFLAQPLPPPANLLGQKTRQPFGDAPFRVCLSDLELLPIWIGA